MNMLKSLLLVVLLTLTLADCKKTPDEPQTTSCQPPATLVAKATCESNYPGALLLASDYKLGSSSQFEFQVYVQKDTLSNDISADRSSWANASNDQIVVPEKVLLNATKFVVQVSILCSGKKQSAYFSFVRRPVPNSSCYVWALQKQ